MNFVVEASGVNPRLPLIYVWSIYSESGALVGRYVGKAKAGEERPRKHYARNVKRLLAKMPYRKKKPDGYRKIHRALADAHSANLRIVLSYECNVAGGKNLSQVELRWIDRLNTKGSEKWQLNG